MKQLHWAVWGLLVVLLVIPQSGFCGDKPTVLKGITAFPKSRREFKVVRELINRIDTNSKGRLKTKWIGGPEVVRGFDQPERGLANQIMADKLSEEKKAIRDAGVQQINLPAADAEKFKTASKEVTWKLVGQRAPEFAPKFRQQTTK